METKLRFYLCTYPGYGRNSSWIELRGIQDLRRDTRGDGLESMAAPFEASVRLLGESLVSIRYLRFDSTKLLD